MSDLKISVDMTDLVKAIKTTDQTKQALRLLGQQFAKTGDPAAYRRSIDKIVIAQQNLPSAMRMTRVEIERLGNEYQQQTVFANALAKAQVNLGVATQRSARGINTAGVITQQAGYQIGDFLVQVQSGTNWMVAFGQQATQVAGTLTLLGGKMILIGSALGIAIPLVTALGAAWMRTRDKAEEAEEKLTSVMQVLEQLHNLKNIEVNFSMSDDFQVMIDFLRQNYMERLQKSFEDFRGSLTSSGGLFEDLLGYEANIQRLGERLQAQLNNLQFLPPGAVSQAEAEINALRQQISNLHSEMQNSVRSMEIIRSISGDTKQEFIESFQLAVQRLQKEELLTDELRASLFAFAEANNLSSELAKLVGDAADEAERFANNLVLGQEYLANAVRAGVASGAIPPQALNSLPQTAGEKAYQDLMERRRREYYANQDKESRSRRGGGRSGTPEFVSRVFGPELQKAIEQAQEDLRLYNQEVKMLDSALQAGLVTQQEYNSFVAQAREAYNQAQQGAYDYSSAMEQVESTAMRSMEGAFMSLIDGSKSASDAFRDMAREILSEAMRLLVIRPLINNLFGGGLGGGGGIFGGIFGRASGGSVMAGQPYLVGEHGPELVIPGRSGTVMNADLTNKAMGGGENVTVVNNFNFSANGDDSVKRIIAAEAPKIAALTQKQIVDQRRRGGQMRSVFG